MTRWIDGDTKRLNALELCLAQGHHRVLNAIILAFAVFAVVKILWITVAQHQEGFNACILSLELADRVSDCRSHTGAAVRFHGCYAPLRAAVIGLGKFLGDKKLHLIATIAGKAIDRVGVA